MKIKRGDTVVVIQGNEKGVKGTVQRVLPKASRIVVNSVNIIKKHQKPVQTGGRSKTQPGIIEYEAPIDVSSVKLICPSCGQPTRVGYVIEEDGEKKRFCKSCNAHFA